MDGIYKNIIELDQGKTCNIGDNICVCVVFVSEGGAFLISPFHLITWCTRLKFVQQVNILVQCEFL